jgi:hypothetical protein
MESEENNEAIPGKIYDFSGNPKNEYDLLPEYCHYRDEGCDLADSCLNCPFPECIYDQPGGKQRWLKRMRDREMTRLYTTEGKGAKELALMFGVSQRTVQRALKLASTDKEVKKNRRES